MTAPAGYGKSTLLAEWARVEDRSVAWVSLDGFDDDPAALLALLASAYGRIAPGSADLIADMGGLGTSALGRAAPRLAAALRQRAHIRSSSCWTICTSCDRRTATTCSAS